MAVSGMPVSMYLEEQRILLQYSVMTEFAARWQEVRES